MWSLGSHNLSTENSYVKLFLSLIDILSHSVPSSTWIFNPISIFGEGGFWIFTHDNSGPNVFFLNVLFCMLIWVLSWLLIAGVIQLREAHLHYSFAEWYGSISILVLILYSIAGAIYKAVTGHYLIRRESVRRHVYVEEMQRKWSANTIALTRRKYFDAMVRIGCIPSFYHSKIIAEFNQRRMIQLWLKTGWWLRIGCIPSFYHVKIAAELNWRWMIALNWQNWVVTENWMHTQFFYFKNCGEIAWSVKLVQGCKNMSLQLEVRQYHRSVHLLIDILPGKIILLSHSHDTISCFMSLMKSDVGCDTELCICLENDPILEGDLSKCTTWSKSLLIHSSNFYVFICTLLWKGKRLHIF